MDSDEGQEIVPIEEQEIQIVAMDDDEEQEIQFVAIPPGPPILNSGKKLNKCNKCDYASSQASSFLGSFECTYRRKVKQMQPM